MDKHNSLFLTEVFILAIFVIIASLITGFIMRFFHVGRPVGYLINVSLVLGMVWLFRWFMEKDNRRAKTREKLP